MSYEMKSLRKEDLSLYLYIKDTILLDFQEVEEYASLTLMPELCESSSYVYQYVTSDYMIDYIDGRIISTRQFNTPKITYTWNYVSVVDEWAAIEAADPPVVVIDIEWNR
jgi:hypothetical protein